MKITHADAVEIVIRVFRGEDRISIGMRFGVCGSYVGAIARGHARRGALKDALRYWRKHRSEDPIIHDRRRRS